TGYNMPGCFIMEDQQDMPRRENTFKKLIQRHESLRTAFELIEEPVQRILENMAFAIENHDAGGSEKKLETIIQKFIRPFELSRPPLLRVGVIKDVPAAVGGDAHHILMVDIHHIISDGVTQALLVKDFEALYMGEKRASLKLHYKDFSEWQNSLIKRGEIKIQQEYWLREFDGEIPVLKLPIDNTRPRLQDFEGRMTTFQLSKEETRQLKKRAGETETTLFMELLALFNILLARLTGQEDIVIGTPAAGRRHMDLEKIIGMFVNTIALRNYPAAEKTVDQFLKEVKERTLQAFENQDYPFDELVEKVSVIRDASRNPLFDVLFSLVNYEKGTVEETDLKLKPYEYGSVKSKFDLKLEVIEGKDKLFFTFVYAEKLFKKETIDAFIRYYKTLISENLENPGKKISEIEILPPEEKQRILYKWNETNVEYPMDKTVIEIFEEKVEQNPENPALTAPKEKKEVVFTYRELNAKSNRLAHQLRTEGVKPGVIVGLMVEPALELMIGLLAILKAGGGFLPLAQDLPTERINYMMDYCNARKVLTQSHLADKTGIRGEKAIIEIGDENAENHECENLSPLTKPHHTLYVIYTSGTTGKPKGMTIKNRNMVNYSSWFAKEAQLNKNDKTILTSSYVFDLGYTSIFTSLLKGGELHLVAKETYLSTEELLDYMKRKRISYMKITPSFFTALIDSPSFTSQQCKHIRLIVLGGEPINVMELEKAYQICNHIRMINHYGPTETTIGSVVKNIEFEKFGAYQKNPTIGTPIHNTHTYILDKNLNPVPPGVYGELYIGGDGVGHGYVNNPELTATKFLADPYRQGGRMYGTGDIARFLPGTEGEIALGGRMDHQVKIRGYRIELGEIDNRLLRTTYIKEAVTVVYKEKNGAKNLAAYIVPASEAPQSLHPGEEKLEDRVREHLKNNLPEYMVPAYIIQMEKLPLTGNGKIDRKKLPEPHSTQDHQQAAPRNEKEEILVELWKKLLGRETIGINDNFFMNGGDSIKAIQMGARLSKTGYKLEMSAVFRYPTIAKLAQALKKAKRIALQTEITGTVPLTPIQHKFFELPLEEPHHYNQAVLLHVKEGFDRET
ncbi:MAG: amino acid adenylation domain-containing protein, partial [bacterium]|nr:amino acid adenylation domain-containing protein [bacterium]